MGSPGGAQSIEKGARVDAAAATPTLASTPQLSCFFILTRLSLGLGHLSWQVVVFPGACSRCGWASFWGLVSIC